MERVIKKLTLGLFGLWLLALTVALITLRTCPGAIECSQHDDRILLKSLQSALRLYQLDHNALPTREQGLQALSNGYLTKISKDAWGQEYQYSPEPWHGVEMTLYSIGPNGVDEKGEGDDIVNWDKAYPCGIFDPCPSLCERAQNATIHTSMILLPIACLSGFAWLLIYVRSRRQAGEAERDLEGR
ncbi:type II secretion system protein GspG [Hahella aquimaris]|uniref:type II secretion system protein GspG n=1 Tax=Hahella sp. HNIBRBA332 TaxID=3015983 RepID=UPI00273B05D1|nr:type II secretion system protein GspG [Hahella sp. HNIBRBA332]WLQ15555.1 type II secretion system protein GspG [Hahella sp. HNIBRBA332]